MEKKIYRKLLSLSQQLGKLKTNFPSWLSKIERNTLILEGDLQPTPLSDKYRVRIKYIPFQRPIVRILSPKLELHPNHKELPHYFHKHDMLCLYYNDFNPRFEYISDKIIVWTSMWLFFYENWLITGEWYGGGFEH